MSQLIYRGILHDGKAISAAPSVSHLVYRGILHTGINPNISAAKVATPMCYRGVQYNLTPSKRDDDVNLKIDTSNKKQNATHTTLVSRPA